MSVSTQSLFSLYSPLTAISLWTDGPTWATCGAIASPESARFGIDVLALDGLSPFRYRRWAVSRPEAHACRCSASNHSTTKAACKSLGRGDICVPPFRQFPTELRPFTLESSGPGPRWRSRREQAERNRAHGCEDAAGACAPDHATGPRCRPSNALGKGSCNWTI